MTRACGISPYQTLAWTGTAPTHGWRLFDEDWVFSRLKMAATAGFENDVAHVVAKLILRRKAAAGKPAAEYRE